jgi:hypothetical protein
MAGIRAQIEPTQYVFEDNRHPDLLLHNPSTISSSGKDIVFDFTVSHSCTRSAIRRGSPAVSGMAAAAAFDAKQRKYAAFSTQNNLDFYGICFETFGHCHHEATSWLEKLAAAAASLHHIPVSVLTAYWKRRISIALQRSNSAMVLGFISGSLLDRKGARNSEISVRLFNDNE